MTTSLLLLRTGRLLKAAGALATVVVVLAGAGAITLLGIGPRSGRYATLTVLSGSMAPTIAPGSVVIVQPIDLADLRAGDVIAFQAPIDGRPTVTHRVVEIERRGPRPLVQTKGDANSSPDPWKVALGPGPGWRVWHVVPEAGRAINLLTRPDVRRVVTLGLPALFLVLWFATLLTGRDEEGVLAGGRTPAPGRPAPPAGPRSPRPSLPAALAVGGACLAVGSLRVWTARHDRTGR